MGWETDVGADAATGFLLADPLRHSSQLTVGAALAVGVRYGEDPPWRAVHRTAEGAVDAAALWTPPYPVLYDGPDDLAAGLAELLAPGPLTGVTAPEAAARAFATRWADLHGTSAGDETRLRMLAVRPGGLRRGPDRTVPVRPAEPTDLRSVGRLLAAMSAELGLPEPTNGVLAARVRAGLVVVADHDGEVVATANRTAPVEGVSRVTGVFTAPAHRARGLAGALVGALTRSAFACGVDVVNLYADAANPTSNGVYVRLGFRPVPPDRLTVRFAP